MIGAEPTSDPNVLTENGRLLLCAGDEAVVDRPWLLIPDGYLEARR